MKWVIQEDVLSEERLTEEYANEVGDSVFNFEYVPFEDPQKLVPKQDELSLFRGSLEMAEKIEERGDLVVFGNSQEFTYSEFYDEWSDHLLNSDVEYVKVYDLSPKHFQNVKFVRPDKGDKAFTGQCFEHGVLWKACKNFIERNTDPDDWLVLSSFKDIGPEYRFVMYRNQVLSGTMYSTESDIEYERITEDSSPWKYIQRVTSDKEYPKEFWVVDVCYYEDRYYVIELNSFSCASWYKCDRAPIFEKLKTVFYK